MIRCLRPLAAGLAVAGLVLTGCSTTTGGEPTAPSDASRTAATTSSAAATTTTTVAAPPTQPASEIPSQYTVLAKRANEIISDNSSFWGAMGALIPRSGFIVADTMDGPCGKETSSPAWICDDAGVMTISGPGMSQVQSVVGDLGMAVVIGHEAGHLALPKLDPSVDTGGDLEERRADCAAGAYMKRIANGQSFVFTNPSKADLDTARTQMMNTPARQAAYDFGWNAGMATDCVTYQP
ncbi:hypothetical protein [Mycolicibacterium brumae]|uniref:Peptidase n=1 Tax=Mycolicibacterium brumae TaxID=85968 RepID=A0A2G5P7S3_9MYCO|nr:hypothetical protein [Mycolicibacterium brumae]MCV7194104.1 hypothetical protein [Mycolicibacterium brumae]PIB74418.1 hypothetical protein CQY22_013195 [Mycolicibacterium brumae]RWA22723.1 hypothetical protein MBRU_12295 [Mycolicibacterium brumae DSM 44177]UWW07471.1 hypothetical protein L2Z93_000486 [Mycolicibacterium brumae]